MSYLGTDHVFSGPMRGLKKSASDGANIQTDRHTGGHCDIKTESAQLANSAKNKNFPKCFVIKLAKKLIQ